MNRKFSLEIDARMWSMSGVGRYIRSIVSRIDLHRAVLRLHPADRPDSPTRNTILDDSRIYGLWEQFRRAGGDVEVKWTPHYDFPLFCTRAQVVTVHDLAHLALPDVFGRGFKRIYATLYFCLLYLWADCVIFISNFTRNEYRCRIGALPPSVVIPNGVDGFWFSGSSLGNCRRHGGQPFRVLVVGNIKPHKNIARLLEALREDGEAGILTVRLIGKAEGFITAERALGRADWIMPLGVVSDEELRKEYHTADCLAMPSLYEGFGLPVLEAMAAGCPVAISDIAPFREIVARSTNAVAEFFAPLDPQDMRRAVLNVLSLERPELVARTEAARQLAREFSWDAAAAATETVLSSVATVTRGAVI